MHSQCPRGEGLRNDCVCGRHVDDRFIQFHKHLELHERYMLHGGVLDVLAQLVGPDVMAMQSMLFLKPPGQTGQAYHQDSFYIKTFPDTLCGAWIAIDDCDEENGCMGFVAGSNNEPIYQEVGAPAVQEVGAGPDRAGQGWFGQGRTG